MDGCSHVPKGKDIAMDSKMNVLVTGAAGFIGSYLLPELVEDGCRVVATDLVPLPDKLKSLSSRVEYVRADMGSESDIYRLMTSTRPSHVIHLASLLAGPCDANPGLGFRINFNSTATMLDAGLVIGLKRFIMTSSISIFGRGLPEPVANDARKEPANIYGQTKLACEHLLTWYRRERRLSAGAVRFPWVFGPGRETGITALYSSKLLDAVARGEALTVDNPEEKGDWLYVRDAVKALKLLLDTEDHEQTAYNIMGGLYTIRQVMEIAKKIRPGARIEYIEGAAAQSPYPSAYDDSEARTALGWRPGYTIEDAVREHIETVSAMPGNNGPGTP